MPLPSNSFFFSFEKVIEEENTTLSILIMPVLRMTKYEWIFSRLIECLPENHVDRGILIKVRDELTRINDATEVDRETARNLDKILALNNYHLKNYIPVELYFFFFLIL